MKKVLVLGDSISIHYGPYLAEYMKAHADCYTKEGREEALKDLDVAMASNCGDSGRMLQILQERSESNALDFDLFVFNCGLHDLKHNFPDYSFQIPPEQYACNMKAIFELTKRHDLPTIFITTTPLEDNRHNQRTAPDFKRYNADVEMYNDIAVKIAKQYAATIIDLNSFVKSLDGEVFIDHVHYLEDVRKLQAAYITGSLLAILK